MHFVPVIPAGESPPDHVSMAVAAAVFADARGCAAIPSPAVRATERVRLGRRLLRGQLARVELGPSMSSDLIVDLGYLDEETRSTPTLRGSA